MNDFLENLKANLKKFGLKVQTGYAKLVHRPLPGEKSEKELKYPSYEINLVPDVKMKMIKAQKMRNLVLFICIVVAGGAIGVVLVLFGVKSGQDIAMSNQDRRLEQMSETLNSYSELNELVAIQGQLKGVDEITSRKTVLSRVFGALSVMLPTGGDVVKLSELRVNLTTDVINMEGQADARIDPQIDYRVLESFKKGVGLTKYDYGRYVDADGKELPTYCIKESGDDGNALRTGDSYYAWWDLTISGCEGTPEGSNRGSDDEEEFHYSKNAEVETAQEGAEGAEGSEAAGGENASEGGNAAKAMRVKIWRTPQFTTWYKDGKMSTDGAIEGIEHFESACIRYNGAGSGDAVKWNSTNDCLLAANGLAVTESSNGRDESDNLVLRFEGTVDFAEEFFAFENKHMMAIGPMGQNVTDSYVQVGSMFTQEARVCDENDTECLTNNTNREGN